MKSSLGRNCRVLRSRWFATGTILTAATGLLGMGSSAPAAPTETNLHAVAVSTSSVPIHSEAPVPKSIFVVPKDPSQGRDPFFPNFVSTANGVKGLKAAAPRHVYLFYKGFSNLDGRLLAIINNHSFAVGEEAEVTAGATRVRVRCLAIGSDRVLVELGGEKQELQLRQGL
jgi:hypothetical protein